LGKLLLAVRGSPTRLARIGIMKALHRHDVREFKSTEKERHWASRLAGSWFQTGKIPSRNKGGLGLFCWL
jgi:hypothetical protein